MVKWNKLSSLGPSDLGICRISWKNIQPSTEQEQHFPYLQWLQPSTAWSRARGWWLAPGPRWCWSAGQEVTLLQSSPGTGRSVFITPCGRGGEISRGNSSQSLKVSKQKCCFKTEQKLSTWGGQSELVFSVVFGNTNKMILCFSTINRSQVRQQGDTTTTFSVSR